MFKSLPFLVLGAVVVSMAWFVAPEGDPLGAAASRNSMVAEQSPAEGVMPGTGMPRATFATMDGNVNGTIERSEAAPWLAGHFDQLDTNADGRLDRAELRTAELPGTDGATEP